MTPELANKIITLAVLKNMVTRLDGEVRTAARESMSPGDRKAGSASGQRIGYVTLTDPEGSYRVTDGEAFRAWVREHRPEEIVAVESVRSSYEKAVLSLGCDEQGEVIPGLTWVEPLPVLQVRPTKDAEAAIRAELASSGLSFTSVLAELEQS
jgi:hypothetical protein